MHLHPANFDYVDPNWKPLTAKMPILKDDDPRILGYDGRTYQPRCYKAFHGKKRTILISPTGSGKCLMQIFHAAREIIESDYKQKQVFIVPQLNIGNGFSEQRHKNLKIGRKIYGWEITTNCCFDNEQSVKKIRNFLLNKHPCKSYRANKVLGGCTAAVSYAALLAAFGKMTAKEKRRAIKNTSFRLDEVHHIMGLVKIDLYVANRLAELCKYVLDNDGSLHLATATFFRGDQHVIVGSQYLKDFEIYRVQFLQYWKTTGIKELHQCYPCYEAGDDLLEQILDAVAAEPNQPPIIIVPSDGMKFFKHTNKWKWVRKLVRGLGKIYGDDKVLDLVSPGRQLEDKKRLVSDGQNFSAIVTCLIGREGTDWPPCSRIHNTVLDANVLQPIQKLGRALRKHDGKTIIKMFNYIEHFDSWDDDTDKIRARLSDRFNAVVGASLLDDMLYPITMPTIPQPQGTSGSKSKRVSLEDVYGSKRGELIEAIMKRIAFIPLLERTGGSIDEAIDEIIEEYSDCMLENVSFDVLKERLRKEIVRRHNPNNPNLRINGLIVDFIREHGWDKVVRKHVARKSPFTGKAETKDLEELHKFLKKELDEKIEEIKKIGIKNIEKNTPLHRFLYRLRRDFRYHQKMEGLVT